MKIFKYLCAVAAIGTAGGLLLAKNSRDKKRQEELDEFLMPETDETLIIDVPRKLEEVKTRMHHEIMQWLDENVIAGTTSLVFNFEDFKDAYKFQEDLSKLGLSSSVNDEDREVEVFYNGDISKEMLQLLSDDFVQLLETNKVLYQGCHYNTK